MSEAAVVIFIFTLFWWVPAAWVYFDAEERGHSGYLWGGLALIWWIPAIVVYFIVRSRRKGALGFAYSRGRIYLHVAIVTTWGLAALAASVILWAVTDYYRSRDDGFPFADPETELRQQLAFGVALLVVAAPALALHLIAWRRGRGRPRADDGERLASARLEGGLASLIVALSGPIAALALVVLVLSGIAAVLEAGGVDRDLTTFALASGVPAAVSLAAAYALFWLDDDFRRGRALVREAELGADISLARYAPASTPARPAALATPPAPPAPATPPTEVPTHTAVARVEPPPAPPFEARFCTQCGTALPSDARFCPRCGAPVSA